MVKSWPSRSPPCWASPWISFTLWTSLACMLKDYPGHLAPSVLRVYYVIFFLFVLFWKETRSWCFVFFDIYSCRWLRCQSLLFIPMLPSVQSTYTSSPNESELKTIHEPSQWLMDRIFSHAAQISHGSTISGWILYRPLTSLTVLYWMIPWSSSNTYPRWHIEFITVLNRLNTYISPPAFGSSFFIFFCCLLSFLPEIAQATCYLLFFGSPTLSLPTYAPILPICLGIPLPSRAKKKERCALWISFWLWPVLTGPYIPVW